jgi:hypothetical protein
VGRMPAFCNDERMAVAVARLLREAGLSAFAAEERNIKGAGDDLILLAAARDGYAAATRNAADFVLLHDAWRHWAVPFAHAGVVVVPQGYGLSADDIIRFLSELGAAGENLGGRLFRLQRQSGVPGRHVGQHAVRP